MKIREQLQILIDEQRAMRLAIEKLMAPSMTELRGSDAYESVKKLRQLAIQQSACRR